MYLSLNEMAERLKVSTRTLRRQIKKQNIPHIKVGRQILFDPKRAELYLECTENEIKPERRQAGHIPIVTKYAERLGL